VSYFVLPSSIVREARSLLRRGRGLAQAAELLGVARADLDLSLWRYLGYRL
jgi:hypothetical protein